MESEREDGPGLSEAQVQAIEQLIAGQTKRAAAAAVGVSPNTMTRWHREAAFVAALNARRLDVVEANTERLRALTDKALAVVEAALDDGNARVRLQAAGLVLQATGLRELPAPSQATEAAAVAAEWQEAEAARKERAALTFSAEELTAAMRRVREMTWERTPPRLRVIGAGQAAIRYRLNHRRNYVREAPPWGRRSVARPLSP